MSSSSLMRTVGSLAASAIIFPAIAHATASYKIQESWEGEKILNHFHFFDQADPTNGFVTYVNQSHAEDAGLVKITETGSLYMGVDYETVLTADGPGRESVRIESNEYYDQGLYVVDIAHMPGSICGTWPAFWAVGPDWPTDGEIDIIEGVNLHDSNKIVLHTSGSCDVGGDYEMSGNMTSSECGDASGTIGCVVEGQSGSSGTAFNKQGGGIYAMEWQKEYLKIWFFPRASIPASLTAGNPDTSSFGTPMAHLQGSCNFKERFTHQKLILDTTFCGDWAGGVFGDGSCPLSDPSNPTKSCVNYVAQNPAEFKNAYWELNSIKIYQLGAAGEVQGTESATTSTQTTTAPATQTTTATETLAPTTSTSVVTGTETSSTSQSTAEATTATTTTVSPIASSVVDSVNSQTASKVTSYVTLTTTLCPVESVQTASFVSSPAPSGQVSTKTTPGPAPVPTTQSAVDSETIIDAVSTSQPEPSSIPPNSVIYTAPDESSSEPSYTIVSTSSQFVTVPTASPSSYEPTDEAASGVDSTASATTPSSPVFTGTASKFSISASAIVGALAMLLLV
ncbi:concanavalin A-like lectin/glucanase domain-containing protein [Aspergillus varians]